MARPANIERQARALARERDYERYVCALFAPREKRTALLALTALNAELARIRHQITEPITGEIRLTWWRDALEKLEAGEVLRHPVLALLAPLVEEGALEAKTLAAMAEARYPELEPPAHRTMNDLEQARAEVLAPFTTAARAVLGAGEEKRVANAALAYDLAGLARNFRADAAKGRCFLPADVLKAEGLNPMSALDPANAETLSRAVAAVMERARGLAAGAGGRASAAQLPLLLQATLARRHLKTLARAGCNPYRLREKDPPVGTLLALWPRVLRGRV